MTDIYDSEERYEIRGDDRRLIEEFRKKPIGHHSPGLQRVLNRFRGVPMNDKYCLVCLKPGREWQLAKTTGVRGEPLKMLDKKFTGIEEAEWYVFQQRWKKHTGETIR